MAFDPFGDHAEKGYLRNFAEESDPKNVKELEHRSVITNVADALNYLQTGKPLTYQDVLKTHETLFKDMYPWAGKDRYGVGREEQELTGDASKRDLGGIITKGPVTFMPSSHAERGVDYALMMGNDPEKMRSSPGEVMGNLAYAHPFLDGNGRTLMAVHSELCNRAGIHVDWSKTNKDDYLKALTQEINDPGSKALDTYLEPHVREGSLELADRQKVFTELPGLSKPEETQSLDDKLISLAKDLHSEADPSKHPEIYEKIISHADKGGPAYSEIKEMAEGYKDHFEKTQSQELGNTQPKQQERSRSNDNDGYGL